MICSVVRGVSTSAGTTRSKCGRILTGVLAVEMHIQPIALRATGDLTPLTQAAAQRPVLLGHVDLLDPSAVGNVGAVGVTPPVINRPRTHDALPAARQLTHNAADNPRRVTPSTDIRRPHNAYAGPVAAHGASRC